MRRPLFVVCLCLVAMAAMRLWFFSSTDSGDSSTQLSFAEEALPDDLDGEVITVTGRVHQKDTLFFIINSCNVASLRQTIPFENKLICVFEEAEDSEELRIGSLVTVQGTVQCFSHATNPGEFDVADYYATLGIGGKLVDVTVEEKGQEYSVWRETLYQLRCYFKERLYTVFPKKEASVLSAMLLGDKTDLDSEIKDLYKGNGIIHILSISGLHITLIGMSIYQMLRRAGIPIWLAAVCGGSILCLYGVMTGLSVSACRAIGMYLIRMLGEVVGRTYDMLTALGILAVLLVWQNPANLHNAGFLLSFGSVLGIGWFYPALLSKEKKTVTQRYEPKKWKRFMKKLWREQRKRLGQSILASMSITLFTLPIQLWFYYEVPMYSVFINLLVLPFMSLVMMTGLVVMILPGSGILGTITVMILQGYEWLCKCFEQLPLHTWNPGKPESWQVLVYYLTLILIVILRENGAIIHRFINGKWALKKSKGKFIRCKHKERVGCLFLYGILTAAVMLLTLHVRSETTVTFLDVGQGDCMIMETVSGEVFLFDCGSTNRSQVGEYVLLPFLKCSGIRHIDAIFVSHPDQDHCSGVQELLAFGEEEGITVGQLVLPGIACDMRAEEMSDLLRAVEESANDAGNDSGREKEIQISYVSAGDSFATENTAFLCLHPPKGYSNEDSNVYSQCFYVEIYEEPWQDGGVGKKTVACSLLLTGDVEGEGEEQLIQELKECNIDSVTVFKVPHHGSRSSTSAELLEILKPQVSVISCGRNNSYGHPHEETLDRLEEAGSVILTTPKCGAITVEIGKEVEVRSWTNPN